MWIQTRVTFQKRLSLVLTSVTLTFDLWPWPFTWTSLLSMVITENFMMIWWYDSGKGVTDWQTDRRTDWTTHRAAWSQLKICNCHYLIAQQEHKNTNHVLFWIHNRTGTRQVSDHPSLGMRGTSGLLGWLAWQEFWLITGFKVLGSFLWLLSPWVEPSVFCMNMSIYFKSKHMCTHLLLISLIKKMLIPIWDI